MGIDKNKKTLKRQETAINNSKLSIESLVKEDKQITDRISKAKKELKIAGDDLDKGKALLISLQLDIDEKIEAKKLVDIELSDVLSVIKERQSQVKLEENKIVDAKKDVAEIKASVSKDLEALKENAINAINAILKK